MKIDDIPLEKNETRFEKRVNLLCVKLHNANLMNPKTDYPLMENPIKTLFDYGDVYFDIDKMRPTLNYDGGYFLHIGVNCDKPTMELITSKIVKPHMDIYISIPYNGTKEDFEKIKKHLEGIFGAKKDE